MLRFQQIPRPALPAELELPEDISPRLARLLYARGARSGQEMEEFLHPSPSQFHSPFLFLDMDKAAGRLKKAAQAGEMACVYGDYDVDGVCATAIMLDTLERLGIPCFYHIPSRHREGYGMHSDAVREIAARGASLIITVDNGVKALEEIRLARELGMEVIVTDHHLCGDKLPEAAAILCHTRPGNTYPNTSLCGAGTAYKLCCALLGEEAAQSALPLVGLATMADVVPLLGENRALVALGLQAINQGRCCPGLLALWHVANEKSRSLTARDLAFSIGPRLNAAGRLENASLCVELLRTRDEEKAQEIARRLDQLNGRRQQEEGKIVEDAARMVEAEDLTDRRSILLKSPDWNPGVIGIAAARIAERFWRPTVLFAERDGILTGSARSIPGVDIHRALRSCESLFLRFGGHAYAAGATLEAGCFQALQNGVEAALQASEPAEKFLPGAEYEEAVRIPELTLSLVEELERLEPFGEGNPEPAFWTEGALLRNVKRIGNGGKHLKATAVQGDSYAEAVLWGGGYRFDELLSQERCDFIYIPGINRWNGIAQIQLQVEAIRGGAVQDAKTYLGRRADKFVDAFSQNILYNKGCAMPWEEGMLERLAGWWREGNGTLALCFTQAGALSLLEWMKEADLFGWADLDFYQNRPGPCAYGAVVLAPVLDALSISRYRRIVCFDGAREGIAQRLKELAPQAALLFGPREKEPPLRFGREDMVEFYRAFRGAERPFFNRAETVDHLCACTGQPRYLARIALEVMLELGFAVEDKGIRPVKKPAQRDLMESKVFAAIAALPSE